MVRHAPDLHRGAATYVAKILKGPEPSELSVEQPTKFELMIDLNTPKRSRRLTGESRVRNLRLASPAQTRPRRTSVHEGACHCGAVRLTLPATPAVATQCNCSLCRRIGGPWVYFEFGTVEIQGHPEATAEYIWGDRTLRTIRCRTCGCVTHWEPLQAQPGARHGVHLGNFDPALIAAVPVRRFDGANTWKFFDELEAKPSATASDS